MPNTFLAFLFHYMEKSKKASLNKLLGATVPGLLFPRPCTSMVKKRIEFPKARFTLRDKYYRHCDN